MSSIRFPLPSDPSKWVDLKAKWSWGDAKAMELARQSGATPEAGALAFAQALLEKMVVDWNLADDNGNKLPLGPESLDSTLEDSDAQAIILKCVELKGAAVGPNP